MKLEIEITIGEKYSNLATASVCIESDPLPDTDLTATITQMIASVRAQAAAKLAKRNEEDAKPVITASAL